MKSYKDVRAVDHVSFEVKKGEVYGIIGPNGAGKTTLMEIMLGLRRQDSGEVKIQDYDNIRDHKKLVYRIGAQLQHSELPVNIKVREAVRLQADLFKAKVDINDLLTEFNLTEKAGSYFSKLSGGQKQRLFILLAVIHNPDIVFFDELSTGLDPVSRQEVWNYVGNLKKRGKTILVSTHFMQEAEQICDRIMLVNKGNVVDIGTPAELTAKLPFTGVIEFHSPVSEDHVFDIPRKSKGYVAEEELEENSYRVFVSDGFHTDDLIKNKDLNISGMKSRQSSFEDYFYYKVKLKG